MIDGLGQDKQLNSEPWIPEHEPKNLVPRCGIQGSELSFDDFNRTLSVT
jgi:hypothetical protein